MCSKCVQKQMMKKSFQKWVNSWSACVTVGNMSIALKLFNNCCEGCAQQEVEEKQVHCA